MSPPRRPVVQRRHPFGECGQCDALAAAEVQIQRDVEAAEAAAYVRQIEEAAARRDEFRNNFWSWKQRFDEEQAVTRERRTR